MAPSISALSPKEEENVKEVLGMRCRAACRPYLQGHLPQFPLQPSHSIQFNLSLFPIDVARQFFFPEPIPLVAGLTLDFTDCATGRTISMAWACRQKRKRMM